MKPGRLGDSISLGLLIGLVISLGILLTGCSTSDNGGQDAQPDAPTSTSTSAGATATATSPKPTQETRSAAAVQSACKVYAAMKFEDASDKAASEKVWALRDGLSGAIADLAAAHHRAWANTDYDAAMTLPSLWPTMQKQCAGAGVKVQNSGWGY